MLVCICVSALIGTRLAEADEEWRSDFRWFAVSPDFVRVITSLVSARWALDRNHITGRVVHGTLGIHQAKAITCLHCIGLQCTAQHDFPWEMKTIRLLQTEKS